MYHSIKRQKSESTNSLTGKPLSVLQSLKPLSLEKFTKEDLKAYFNNSFDLYETVFSSIKSDSVYYLCPDRLRLPLIFYYGHTAAVYVNKLVLADLIQPNERINLEYETTFETGVDEMSWDDIEHPRMGGDYKWPSVRDTREFRLQVRKLIIDVINRTPLELPVTMESKWWALFMGFEHERIHLETSTVLIRQYPIDMVTKPNGWNYGPFNLNNLEINNSMIKVDETNVRLGKNEKFPSYGWDNEYGKVDCKVSPFEASKYKITNEEFLEFVLCDGYKTREYWSEEGWEWVRFKKARHPLFWVCPNECKSGCGGVLSSYSHCQKRHFTEKELDTRLNYKFRLMFDVISMPLNWPVECNYHEAKAFCKWKGQGYRVLSEAEHHAIRDHEIYDLNPQSDVIFVKNSKINHNLLYGSSTPVDFFPPNIKGFHDVFGNVWEWTEDHFNGLPGHKTHYLYDDFSTPCYDGRHNLIMGGSWASTGDEASHFARFMFRRHFYQHCGFRLARSIETSNEVLPDPQIRLVEDRIFLLGSHTPENPLNLDKTMLKLNFYPSINDQYFFDSCLHPELFENELTYENDEFESKWFDSVIKEMNNLLLKLKVNLNIATHIGSSTGRITFQLAKIFKEVIGIDFSSKLLDIAIKLQSEGHLEIKTSKNSKPLDLDIRDNSNSSSVIFKQMTWIPNEIPKSDLVIFTMIHRVTNPLSWLKRFREILKPDGLLIIYSRESKFNSLKLLPILNNEFELISEFKLNKNDTFSAWKISNK